jgi:hypothetical protein
VATGSFKLCNVNAEEFQKADNIPYLQRRVDETSDVAVVVSTPVQMTAAAKMTNKTV